jgi:hypothetical protein
MARLRALLAFRVPRDKWHALFTRPLDCRGSGFWAQAEKSNCADIPL